MAGEDLMGEESQPAGEIAIPGSQALQEGVRAIIEECVEKTVLVREVHSHPFAVTDDKARDDERRASERYSEVETIVRLFDRHLPRPTGETWRVVIHDRARAVEEQRQEDADEGT